MLRLPIFGRAMLFVAVCSALGSGQAGAQDPAGEKIPPPETALVTTKDGMQIVMTYLAGTKGKESVPVILLHMFKGNRHEMEGLGQFLQAKGHAVIMPDLRGHGDSTTAPGGKRLDAATMPVAQLANMITQDMEAIKKFIIEKHNAAALNIERLCVLGSEMSVQVAVNWAWADWSATDLPTLKQSKDVKALVLLSPTMAFKTLSLTKAINFEPLRDRVAFYILAGAEDTTSVNDARRLAQSLERFRPKPTKIEEKTVFLEDTLKTKLVGSKVLGEKTLGVDEVIAEFIELRLVTLQAPWKERLAP